MLSLPSQLISASFGFAVAAAVGLPTPTGAVRTWTVLVYSHVALRLPLASSIAMPTGSVAHVPGSAS